MVLAVSLQAQVEPGAGTWRPWFLSSAKVHRLPPPSSGKAEIADVLLAQKSIDARALQEIQYWGAGAPGYRWHEMINKLWMYDTSRNGALANLLMGTAIYDATLVAWDTKYAYRRSRPFAAGSRIRLYVPKPESPSYPCEHSVAAGVAVTILSHFYPHLADSVNRMALQQMASRVAAGAVFPSDTRAGFALGKQIAEQEIKHTSGFVVKTAWEGKVPEGSGLWRGKRPMYPQAGQNKTVVLEKASQFRPGPPPDFAKEMAELKGYKQTFRSQANAFYWASQDYWSDVLNKKIFEHNLHLNPPQAARLYAVSAVAAYDGFAACWDAKYTYWGIRPDQYDTTYRPLVPTPPFPGYPSGHAMMSGMFGGLYAFLFPEDTSLFQKKAKDAAESRFQAGIHFRSDNEAGLELGHKIASAIILKLTTDGSGKNLLPDKKAEIAVATHK